MTLMEVLMSCAIMTIGVVMVATVFPLSTLRVLEASRQTNSTIVRFGAEALIDVDPMFLHSPNTPYPVPPNSSAFNGRVYFVDPYGYQTFHRDAGLPAPVLGTGSIPVASNPLLRDTWGTLPPGSAVNVPLPRRYTGATMFLNEDLNLNGTLDAGEDTNGDGVLQTPYPVGANTAGSDNAIVRAIQLVGQPDNWKLEAEGLVDPVSSTTGITSLTLELDVDLSAVPTTISPTYPTVAYRAVIFDRLGDAGGARSEIRMLTASSGNASPPTISWTTPLPAHYENGNISKVRIERLDEVYTWALTVRKRPAGQANVDVVVFSKRSFNVEHEYVYPASFRRYSLEDGTAMGGTTGLPGADNYDDNGNGVTDEVTEIGFTQNLQLPSANQSDDQPNTVVRVDFASLPSGSPRPVFRRGGYVCDTKNGLWYRIQGIQNETDTTIELGLDRFIQLDGTEDLIQPVPLPYPYTPTLDATEDRNGNGALDIGGIYWNPSVINVFPLEPKEPPP